MRQVSTSPNRHFRARGFEFLVWGLSVWLRLLGLGLWFGNQRTSKALLVRGWDSIKIEISISSWCEVPIKKVTQL